MESKHDELGLIVTLFTRLSNTLSQCRVSFGVSYFAIIFVLVIGIVVNYKNKESISYFLKTLLPKSKRKITVSLEKSPNKTRKYGQWTPEEFTVPLPPAFPDWDIKTTKPTPYRAFKHTYFITMGIRSMDWDNWIELDNEWHKYHSDKLARLSSEKEKDFHGMAPEAVDASFEILDELVRYLPARYPNLFRRIEGWGIENLETGEKFDTRRKSWEAGEAEEPCLIIAKLIQDDFAIMLEGEDGNYYLKAGAIMLAGFWRLKDKFGLPLSAIHTTGDVPKYNEKLKSGMEKFFIRQTVDKPVVRNNYFIQTDDELAWSSSIGDEDNEVVGWYTAEPAKTIEQIYFRSERQSLRRFPITGATLFTIRTYFLPVTELCKEPYVPRRLLDGINSWTDDVQEYRGYAKFKDVILPYLEAKAKEQEAMGWTVDTEPVSYPF